jgi:hypothetical protein
MHVANVAVPLGLAVTLTGCLLDAQVPDTPGASIHILPAGAPVPPIATNRELANQIQLNDGIDDLALASNGGVIPRSAGNGGTVHYWSFGAASAVPATLYQLVKEEGGARVPIDHPMVINALPGDPGYNPLHAIVEVVVNDPNEQRVFPSIEALSDAAELGYVDEAKQRATRTFVNIPIVPAGTLIQIGDTRDMTAPPNAKLYARGYEVEAFRFGGDFGVQSLPFTLPTRDVSFVRKQREAEYDPGNPIFQAAVPLPGPDGVTYSALSRVVRVDLTDDTNITSDDQLFRRNPPMTGEIANSISPVLVHEITPTTLVLQLQFPDGL